MEDRTARVNGVVVCACVALLCLGAVAGGASAAPGGGPGQPSGQPSGRAPSQDEVDQAKQAVVRAEAAMSPVQASLDSAQRQLTELDQRARAAADQVNGATVRLRSAQAAARRTAADMVAAHEGQDAARAELGRLAADAYRNANGFATITMILTANGPQQFAERVHLLHTLSVNRQTALREANQTQQEASAAQAAADRAMQAEQQDQAQLAAAAQKATSVAADEQAEVAAVGAQRDQLLTQLAAAQSTSTQLEQERQQNLASEAAAVAAAQAAQQTAQQATQQAAQTGPGLIDPAVPAPTAPSPADAALAFARAQLGKPYLWGAVGPDSYDCSGLTMRAYDQAGLSLPHFAASQFQASHPLTFDQLRPGDLLFWATDPQDSNTIYHEAIYLGGGQMIQSPKTGWDVMVSDMWMWGPIQFYARPY